MSIKLFSLLRQLMMSINEERRDESDKARKYQKREAREQPNILHVNGPGE